MNVEIVERQGEIPAIQVLCPDCCIGFVTIVASKYPVAQGQMLTVFDKLDALRIAQNHEEREHHDAQVVFQYR